jgi:hypothetical protein
MRVLFLLIVALALIPSMARSATRSSATVFAAPRPFWGLGSADDKPIDLDLDNVPVRAALKRILDPTKLEYKIDDDVPDTARVTLRAHDIRLSTALDVVTQTAGIGWTSEMKDAKRMIHVGKSIRGGGYGVYIAPQVGDLLHNLEGLTNQRFQFPPNSDFAYRLFLPEQRSTFTCPHCKGQVTMLGSRQQPKCPKCGRTFQSDWQFCPADGTKRPPAPGVWHYCPLCGKPVDTEKNE